MNWLNVDFFRVKGKQLISRSIVIGVVMLIIILGTAGCSSNIEPISATWVTMSESSDTVSIPVNAVTDSQMVHFLLGKGPNGDVAFMVYELDREIYVRSNVCPPCWSVGFSLQKDILVCDSCATTFNAKTGDGLEGSPACVSYPKASVPYEIKDDMIIMNRSDLITSYQNTLEPGLP
jgi:uncharacterized membrane protein